MIAPFVRLEALCSSAVERAFAFAFPAALQPVVIARKLAATFEAQAAANSREYRRYTIRLHPRDYARLQDDLPYLERQWNAMLARLAERSRSPRPADVAARADAAVAAGTVTIAIDAPGAPAAPLLALRDGARRLPLPRGSFVIGRDPACDFVIADPRVSRRHLAVVVANDVAFRDLGSSNGTRLNGIRVAAGALACGDVLRLGESELVVDAER